MRLSSWISPFFFLTAAVFPVLWAEANDPVPGKAGPISWEAGPGASLSFKGLAGPTPLASSALPNVELSELPEARVVLRQGVFYSGSGPEYKGASVSAICLRASASDLPANLDDIAFEKMNEKVSAEFKKNGAQIDEFSPGRSVKQGHLMVMPFEGKATPARARPGVKEHLQGKHFVGFLGEPPEVLLCSAACLETTIVDNYNCGSVADSLELRANFLAPPTPSFFLQVASAAVRRPLAVVGVLLGGLITVLGMALLAWPTRRKI